MLGGGNPAHIPEVEEFWRKRWLEIAADPQLFGHLLRDYDPPAGKLSFRQAIADYFRQRFAWDIGPEHVAITAGSQAGYFLLFNLLAGEKNTAADASPFLWYRNTLATPIKCYSGIVSMPGDR